MKRYYLDCSKDQTAQIKNIQGEIDKYQDRISKGQQTMLDSHIEISEHKEVKPWHEPMINELIREQQQISEVDPFLNEYLVFFENQISNLENFYQDDVLAKKKALLDAFNTDRLINEKMAFRTKPMNVGVDLICRPEAGSGGSKKLAGELSDQSYLLSH